MTWHVIAKLPRKLYRQRSSFSSSGSRRLVRPHCSLIRQLSVCIVDILKFHYLAQLLFDSNCLLLVLKMFGLSDVWQTVTVKNECEDYKCVSGQRSALDLVLVLRPSLLQRVALPA